MDTQLGHEGATRTLEHTIERRTRRPIWPYLATALAVLAVTAATLVVALDTENATPATPAVWDDAKLDAFGKRQLAEPVIRDATAELPAGFVDGQTGVREGGTYAHAGGAGFVDGQTGVREGGTYANARGAGFVDGQVESREGGTYLDE